MSLLSVEDLTVTYETGPVFGPGRRRVTAIESVGFDLAPGETLGVVGESGSGKSTTGRAVLRLTDGVRGRIVFDGLDVTGLGRRTPLSYRRDVQAVFQDPSSSLNPSHPVYRSLTDALRRHGIGAGRSERGELAAAAFERVGLSRAHLHRFPSELSGGQQQRVAIARALVLRPRLVVCDEAVSALDLSTQGQIINLLADLQAETGVAYLFIAHDLRVVRHLSHRVAVMHAGRLVEVAPTEQLFSAPRHPYTRALLAASPATRPEGRERRRARRAAHRSDRAGTTGFTRGEEGCLFRDRCGSAMEVCGTRTPLPRVLEGGVRVACHLYEDAPTPAAAAPAARGTV
ncbi:Glutathione import ATP-binding protein GsiA [Nocardiopsis dassonvillei]|uniref:oligopeptide/dipeptide ABC transporter ATP-binding protein n=1 Tax=Nocardiopsis dassonvillei TaxID=2014 RepID=UPI003F54BFBA